MDGTAANQAPKLKIANAKLHIPAVNLVMQENIKLLKQLESGFKRRNDWNKYHFKKNK